MHNNFGENGVNRTLYDPRPGSNIAAAIEVLDSEPEIQLTQSELDEVKEFERNLTLNPELGQITDRVTGNVETVQGVQVIYEGNKVNTTLLNLDYFLTPEGELDLLNTLNVDLGGTYHDFESLRRILYNINYSEYKAAILKDFSGRSKDFIEDVMINAFAAAGYVDSGNLPLPTGITIIRNPDVLLEKVKQYRLLHEFHKYISNELRGRNDNTSLAKQLLLQIHQRRVNIIIADQYALGLNFLKQDHYSPTPIATLIKEYLPILKYVTPNREFTTNRSGAFFSRLDLFMHGVGVMRGNGYYSPISAETLDLAAKLEASEASEKLDGVLGEYSLEELQKVKINAEEWKKWVEICLAEYGLLSEQSDYDPDRPGKAIDDKWQAVIDPLRNALSIGHRQFIVRIPQKYNKGIVSNGTGGALPVLDHEFAHVIQNENLRRLGLSISEIVGLGESSMYNEAGSIMWESDCYNELFGLRRTTNLRYLKAIQEKLNGGSFWTCVRTYFKDYMQANPHIDKKEAIKTSISSVKRIYRNGGSYRVESPFVTDSAVLHYLEQALITGELERRGRSNLLMSGVNLEILAELKRYGLASTEHLKLPNRRPSEIVLDQVRKRIVEVLGER